MLENHQTPESRPGLHAPELVEAAEEGCSNTAHDHHRAFAPWHGCVGGASVDPNMLPRLANKQTPTPGNPGMA